MMEHSATIFAYPLTAMVTVLVSLLTFVFAGAVGRERARSKIRTPAMVGDEQLERAIRVHYNSIEQLVIFLPVLWLFAVFESDFMAAMAGGIWVLSRILYALAYRKNPANRQPAFMLGFLVYMVISFWTLVEIFRAL